MYHFDGSHRLEKTISLGGQKGTTARNELLKTAYRERLERERDRAKNLAAKKIVRAWTRYRTVRLVKSAIREDLERILKADSVPDWLTVARLAVVSFDPRSLDAFQQLISVITFLDTANDRGVKAFAFLVAESAVSQSWLFLIGRIIENSVRSFYFSREYGI